MKLMKRIASLALVLTMLLSCVNLQVFAADPEPQINIDAEAVTSLADGKTKDGTAINLQDDEWIRVRLMNTDEVGIALLRVYIYCDTSVIKVPDAVYEYDEEEDDDVYVRGGIEYKSGYNKGGQDFGTVKEQIAAGTYTGDPTKTDGYYILWYYGNDNVSRKNICDFYLTAENAFNGDYTIEFECASVKNFDEENLVASNPDALTITVSGGMELSDVTPVASTEQDSYTYTYPEITTVAPLTVTATLKGEASEALTYQWYKVEDGTATAIEDETAAAYTPSLAGAYGTDTYRCVVTNVFQGKEYTDSQDFTVTKTKGVPTYTVPTGLTATYGQTLADVELPEGFAWQDAAASVGAVGNNTFKVDYTPADTANYESVTGIDVTVAVGKADPTYTVPTGLTATYGQKLSDVELPAGFTWKNADASVGNMGTNSFVAIFTPDDADNYNAVEVNVEVTVGKADPSYTVPSLTASFGQTLADVALPAGFAWEHPLSTSVGAVGNQTFTVTYTPDDTENYNVVTGIEVTVVVGKAASGVTSAPTAISGLGYTGESFALINAGAAEGGTMKYSLDGTTFSETIPSASDAGEYTVWYYVEGDANHADTAKESVTVSIAKATLDVSGWTWTGDLSATYDGTEKAVVLSDANTGLDMVKVTYQNNTAVDVGAAEDRTAVANLTLKDEYAGNYALSASKLTQAWTLARKQIDVSGVTFAQSDITWDGKEHSVAVSNLPAEGVAVAYTSETGTEVGTYEATATLSAENTNYTIVGTASLSLTWNIVKVKVEVPAAQNHDFDGTVKTGVESGEFYTLSGDVTATNAGDAYTVTVTLVDPAHYEWSDASFSGTLTWKIAKAAAQQIVASKKTMSFSNADWHEIKFADMKGDAGEVTVAETGVAITDDILTWKFNDANDGILYQLKEEARVAASVGKTPTITITFNSENYADGSTYEQVIEIINKTPANDKIKFENDPGELTYNGEVQTYEYAQCELTGGTIEYTYSPAEVKNVGTYTVTAKFENELYTAEVSKTFEIVAKEISVKSAAVADKVYNASNDAVVTAVEFDGLCGEDTVNWEASATFEDANVGEDKNVNVTVSLEDADNYVLAASGSSVVAKADITKASAVVSLKDIADVVFTGDPIEPEVEFADLGGIAESELRYDVAYSTDHTNVGEVTVTVTDSDDSNYDFSASTKFNITKKAAPVLASGSANVKFGAAETKVFTINGLPKNAGEMSATYAIDDAAVLGADNVSIDLNAGTVTVDVAAVADTFIDKTAQISVTISSRNYEDLLYVASVTRTAKDSPEAKVDDVAITYTGVKQSMEILELSSKVDGTWTWVTNPTDQAASEAGYDAAVKFTPDDLVNYAEETVNFKVYIEKAEVVVEAEVVTDANTTLDQILVIDAPEGVEYTVTWYDKDGNVIAKPEETKVEPNAKYSYSVDFADDNYEDIPVTEIIPYEHEPAAPSNIDLTYSTGKHGVVTVNPKNPQKGNKVVITVKPDAGYEVDDVVVTNGKKSVDVYKLSDTQYAFVMPAGKVKIDVSYSKVSAVKFLDVASNAWYHDAVYAAVELGLFNGVTANTFNPDGSMTRAMLVTVLWRLSGSPAAGSSDFADVAKGSWYAEAVAWASREGIVNGISADEFAPDNNITREQMAAMLYRYAKYMGLSTSYKADLSAYADADSISDYAKDAMAWAVGAGLINGVTATTLNPAGSATRAQVATILVRFVEKYL